MPLYNDPAFEADMRELRYKQLLADVDLDNWEEEDEDWEVDIDDGYSEEPDWDWEDMEV